MNKKDNDPFGFNKAINWDKLEDPEVLKEISTKLQAPSSKLQAPSSKQEKTLFMKRLKDY